MLNELRTCDVELPWLALRISVAKRGESPWTLIGEYEMLESETEQPPTDSKPMTVYLIDYPTQTLRAPKRRKAPPSERGANGRSAHSR